MPIYEYRCDQCDEHFEELLSSSSSPMPPCPTCGASDVTRVYSQFATEWKPSIVNWHRMPGKW
jgi:putative FmdB family regulatory protein